MKFLVLLTLVMTAVTNASANGFVCHARNTSLTVKAYDHASTSTAAVMILADSLAKASEQTIARFSDAEGTLSGGDSRFVADVDLRFKDQHEKEALVAGKAQLQELNTIELDVNYDPLQDFSAGESLDGVVHLTLRAGGQIDVDVSCTPSPNN